MRLVFAGWDGSEEHSVVNGAELKIALPADVRATAPLVLHMQALHVQRLDENNAVLLVKGEPSEKGLPTLIAAYWFNRRAEAWSLVNRQDVVEWLGAAGHVGNTSVVELFPGHFALAVEYGLVDKNESHFWLRLFRIGNEHVSPMMDKSGDVELARHFESESECGVLLRPLKGKNTRQRLHIRENEANPPTCYDYEVTWDMISGSDAPGVLVVDYAGKTYQYLEVGHHTDTNGEHFTVYDLRMSAQKGRRKWVFDNDSQQYVLRDEKPPSRKK